MSRPVQACVVWVLVWVWLWVCGCAWKEELPQKSICQQSDLLRFDSEMETLRGAGESGLPVTLALLNIRCLEMRNLSVVADNLLRRCTAADIGVETRKTVEQVASGAKESIQQLCDDQHFIDRFKLQTTCLENHLDRMENCNRHIRNVTLTPDMNLKKQLRNVCCAYKAVSLCLRAEANKECNRLAGNVMMELEDKATSRLKPQCRTIDLVCKSPAISGPPGFLWLCLIAFVVVRALR